MEKLLGLLVKLLALAVIIGTGALVSWIFHHFKKRDLFGGFIGGMVVGVLGALIGAFVLDKILLKPVLYVLNFLVGRGASWMNVNIIAAFIGGYLALFVMNKLNHDKERSKY